jgi:hypothetical protein
MLRVSDEEVDGSLRSGVTHIVEDSSHPSMTVRAVVAVWARPPSVITAPFDDLRFREILNACDSLCPIRPVLPGCRHLSSLQAKNFFSAGEIGLERRSLERKPQYLCYRLVYYGYCIRSGDSGRDIPCEGH